MRIAGRPDAGVRLVARLPTVARSIDDLVMAMSTELLGVDDADLGHTIRSELERLGEVVGADRAYVLKTSVEGRSAGEAFEEWWAPGVEQRNTPIANLPREAQRFWFRSLRAGEVVHAEDISELAERCPEAEAALRADGVCSILFVPLLAKDQTVGFIGFERRRRSLGWEPATISRIRTVGELIVSSVERCHADTERAASARHLAARNAELERSNRELQQFASIVSHDLNQPLVVVQGFLDQLRAIAVEHPSKEADATRYADAAQRATGRMRVLINDVLEVARAGAPVGKAEPVDLAVTVEDALSDLEVAVADAGGVVTVGPLPVVEGSPTQLRQLFQNLIANALKFRDPDRALVVELGATQAGDRYEITVADNGIGIPPEHRHDVFEMFVRQSETTTAGLGIGLAVCARVVANHHGRIRIDGNDSGGSTVHITLPSHQPTPTPPTDGP
jgi:signal transduction histidine kinase